MNIIQLAAALGGRPQTGIVVSPNTTNASNLVFNNPCYGGVTFNSGGTEFETVASTGGQTGTNRGVWLDSGLPGEVWVERTINADVLNHVDPGAGRHQLSTSRQFANLQTPTGVKTTNVTFDFWDAAAGGNNLASYTIDIIAENTL